MMYTPFEPKVAFRHKLLIDGLTAYTCKASNTPSIDNGEIVVDYINVDFKVKGKSRWQDITVTLYDPVTPSAAAEVHDWIKAHHNSSTGIDGFAFQEYKKDITLMILDPHGSPVEVWDIKGAFINSAKWGDMDWASDEAKMIELNLKYDWAVLV